MSSQSTFSAKEAKRRKIEEADSQQGAIALDDSDLGSDIEGVIVGQAFQAAQALLLEDTPQQANEYDENNDSINRYIRPTQSDESTLHNMEEISRFIRRNNKQSFSAIFLFNMISEIVQGPIRPHHFVLSTLDVFFGPYWTKFTPDLYSRLMDLLCQFEWDPGMWRTTHVPRYAISPHPKRLPKNSVALLKIGDTGKRIEDATNEEIDSAPAKDRETFRKGAADRLLNEALWTVGGWPNPRCPTPNDTVKDILLQYCLDHWCEFNPSEIQKRDVIHVNID